MVTHDFLFTYNFLHALPPTIFELVFYFQHYHFKYLLAFSAKPVRKLLLSSFFSGEERRDVESLKVLFKATQLISGRSRLEATHT